MMFKIRQGLTLHQSLKHPGLVSRFLHGHQVLNLTEGNYPINPVLWASILEEINCREYMEPDDGLSGPLRNSNLIHPDLSASVPSTLSIFFTLGTKGMGGGWLSRTERGKAAEGLENLLMVIVWIEIIEILQQKCDHSALC
jgi:hypothetical protein